MTTHQNHGAVKCSNCHVVIRQCKCILVDEAAVAYDVCTACEIEVAAHEVMDSMNDFTDDPESGTAFVITTGQDEYLLSNFSNWRSRWGGLRTAIDAHVVDNPMLAATYDKLKYALFDIDAYAKCGIDVRKWGVREIVGVVLPFHDLA